MHPDKLVFLGARNLARIAWCPMQALRKSREDEFSLFWTYLEDRLQFALDTGRLRGLPSDRRTWLEIAARDVTLRTVEAALLPDQPLRFGDFSDYPDYWEVESGERTWAEPDLPTMRWHVQVDEYVVVGQPDGLSRTEVVEAKASRTRYLAEQQRPVGELQADLYGLLFQRETRILCGTIGDGDFTLEEGPVEIENAARCLKTFARLETGWIPPPPLEAWKCRRCEVESGCPISRAGQ